MQEALARAYDRGEQIADLRAWVSRVALNQVRSHMRHLAAELGRLPVGQRQVVVLHYLLDMGVTQMASLLGVHEGTVKTQLHRARNSLRARLDDDRATTEEANHARDR